MAGDEILRGVTPNAGWGASLRGEPSDLEGWIYVLRAGFDPWVEVHGSETVLRSSVLDQMTTADEVRDLAIVLIDRLNGAVALSEGAKPIAFGGAIKFDPDGKLHRTMFAEMGAFEMSGDKMRAVVVVLGPDGQSVPPPPPQPTAVQTWVGLAEQDEMLEDALVYFGRSTDWFDIYKCLECLQLRAKGETSFLALDWAPKAQVELLKQTANWHRHARRRFLPPAKPMPLKEARSLLAVLLRRALEEFKASNVS
jgi:hypothetical protein